MFTAKQHETLGKILSGDGDTQMPELADGKGTDLSELKLTIEQQDCDGDGLVMVLTMSHPTCTTFVVIGTDGTVIDFEQA